MRIFARASSLLKYEDLTIFLVVTIIAMILIDDYFRRRKWRKFKYQVSSLPVIGSVHHAIGEKDLMTMYLAWMNKFKAPFLVRAFYDDYYITIDVDEIRKVVLESDCLNKGANYYLFRTVMPNSILIAERNIWKPKRRAYAKAFNKVRLNRLLPIVNGICDNLMAALVSRKNENFIEISERIIVDGTMVTLLGCDEATRNNPLLKKLDMYSFLKRLFEGTIMRYMKPWLYADFVYLSTKDGKALINMSRDFYNAISYIMKVKREEMKHKKVEERERDLITIAVEENISEQEIVNDMITFLFAASETSALTLGFACTLLAIHKNFQEELYNEVVEVVGNSKEIDAEQLSKLKFTEMVLNETMRLFPSFPFVGRKLDTEIDLGQDRILPKHTSVIISIFGVHRSERYWEKPEEFNPYRFLPDEVEKRDPTAFIPFSIGPRNCIGANYSMMVMKTMLAKLIKSYEVSSSLKCVQDIKFGAFVSLNVEDIECTFTLRST